MTGVHFFGCSPDESGVVKDDVDELERLVERFWLYEDRPPTVDEAAAFLPGVARSLVEQVLSP